MPAFLDENMSRPENKAPHGPSNGFFAKNMTDFTSRLTFEGLALKREV
jgi:hypothetical protein